MESAVAGAAAVLRHPLEPRKKPQHAGQSEDDEERTPAEAGHEQSAEEHAESGAEHVAGGDDGIGEAAMLFGEVEGDDFRVRREGHGFADAEEQPQDEQHGEEVDDAGSSSGGGP